MMLRVLAMIQEGHSLKKIANDLNVNVAYLRRILKDAEVNGGVHNDRESAV